jgi:hypothetical protein
LPSRDLLAARLADGLCTTFIDYEAGGFEHFVARWPDRDLSGCRRGCRYCPGWCAAGRHGSRSGQPRHIGFCCHGG